MWQHLARKKLRLLLVLISACIILFQQATSKKLKSPQGLLNLCLSAITGTLDLVHLAQIVQ